MAKNLVIGGVFEKSTFNINNGVILIGTRIICKQNIKRYEVITEDIRKSGTSVLLRGVIGIAMLGSIGIIASATAKNKTTYTIAIEWDNNFLNSKDKKKGNISLIEMDEKLYRIFIKTMI